MTDSIIKDTPYHEQTSTFDLLKERVIASERLRAMAVPLAVFVVALLPRILSLGAFMKGLIQ